MYIKINTRGKDQCIIIRSSTIAARDILILHFISLFLPPAR